MKRNYFPILALLFMCLILGLLFYTMFPQRNSDDDGMLTEFSTVRALTKVSEISKQPHYVGSKNHEVVANYLQKELKSLGLQPTVQEGFTLSKEGDLVQSRNILARIKGETNAKALLLLSHYDSAPHSYSPGAGDAGSGIATILESIRAFLHNKTPHKNDIIILFSDAEELDSNGASLFVTQHPWAKEIGLALNFEARGSSGPSYMLMETNQGNAGLVKEFAAAKVAFPVSNSVLYSLYKLLPNATDLTIFREKSNIQGYNFAFIDDHYNYHTAQDDIKHLNKNTLKHQGSYVMPLLNYFSNAPLSATQATQDAVYFTIPYAFIHYPYTWVLPMASIALVFFILLVLVGIAKRMLCWAEILKGFIPFLISIALSGLVCFIGWQALLLIYPQYTDLLNGFTYNGHAYTAGFVLLAIAISFMIYERFSPKKESFNYYVAPLLVWMVINIVVAFALKGAGFLIIPVYFGLFTFGFFIITQKFKKTLTLFLSIPALLLISPFVQMLPIGLGSKMLFVSAILTSLTFGLLLPIFIHFSRKGVWALVFFLISLGFFTKAHWESGYELEKAKPNSLVYLYNADTDKASWATYDTNLDSWTKYYLGSNPKQASPVDAIALSSKYNSGFTYAVSTPKIPINMPSVEFIEDQILGNQRHITILISPNRTVNRYDVFANKNMILHDFKANGVRQLGTKKAIYKRKDTKILSYYVVNNTPLEIKFNIDSKTVLEMELIESSFDLMTNPFFTMKKRENWMMPTPFVLNDAIIIKKKIKPNTRSTTPIVIPNAIVPIINDSSVIRKDSI